MRTDGLLDNNDLSFRADNFGCLGNDNAGGIV